MAASADGDSVSSRLRALTANPSGEPCEVRIRNSTSCSGSMRAAADCRLAARVPSVASARALVLARTITAPAPNRAATIRAAPFASLANTVWSAEGPIATTLAVGLAGAADGASADNVDERRSERYALEQWCGIW